MKSGGNLNWCKPLSFKDGEIVLSVCEGEIVGCQIGGEEHSEFCGFKADLTPLAKLVNDSYDYYSGWEDTHIILDAVHEELECRDCPCFGFCEAMDEEVL